MKRDWDTIRGILIKFEDLRPDAGSLQLSDFPADRGYEYSYHVALLLEGGIIDGKMLEYYGNGPKDFIASRMTWEGHEFLDSIRSDTVWNKTKKSFRDGGLSMTFELVKSVATEIVIKSLGR